jgi:hypothetical protein
MHRWATLQMAILGSVMLVLVACAQTQAPAVAIHETRDAPVPAVTLNRPAAGLRMYVDPITGEMREPTDAELAAEATTHAAVNPATGKSGAARTVLTTNETVLPGGIIEMRNDHRADVQERVCEQPDGSLSSRCPPEPAMTGNKARKP